MEHQKCMGCGQRAWLEFWYDRCETCKQKADQEKETEEQRKTTQILVNAQEFKDLKDRVDRMEQFLLTHAFIVKKRK